MGRREAGAQPEGRMMSGCFGAIWDGFSVNFLKSSRVTVRLVWFLSWV